MYTSKVKFHNGFRCPSLRCTCPQDSRGRSVALGFLPRHALKETLSESFHGFNQQHTQTSITFHVGCTGIALQGYAPSLFTSSSLTSPLACPSPWLPPPTSTHLLPPHPNPPTDKADHCQPFVVARRGRPSVRVPDPTLCDPALSPFASHSHQQSLCNDIL